ncbi:MAG: SusD/RagB family nutrient-binding outer membrane lipoprotein [Saprospiraceae bacterium]
MKKIIKLFSLISAFVIISSCSLDLLDNPNAVTAKNTDVNYLLNAIELGFRSNFDGFSGTGAALTRILHFGGAVNYENAVSPGGFSGVWDQAYAGILIDVKNLITLAEASSLFVHAGIAKTIRAYELMTLVDFFGDVPLSEALDAENFNPKVDLGKDVYTKAIADLDAAIANFAAPSKGAATSDLFFGGNADSWTRVANTLKLKAALNLRLIDKSGSTSTINSLVAGNKLISTYAQNFAFKFGANLTNPDTRHPRYGYTPTGGNGDYMSNSYMGALYNDKTKPDPRVRYYFYRQVTKNTSDVNELRCINNNKPAHYGPDDAYCLPTSVGYWGRDHLSNEGIPPDNLKRTVWGLYPAGGLFDDDAGKGVSQGAGAGGAGIHPIMMRSFVDFMLAEAALSLGTTGDAKALLKSAIEKSMADVRTLALASTEATKINTFETSKGFVWATEVTNYVNEVMARYDAAATEKDKLAIIAKEYWLSLWGSGVEAYNLYRRTGKPDQQPALDASPGPFASSVYYPTNFIARNSNAVQKASPAVHIFWDNNPPGFVK